MPESLIPEDRPQRQRSMIPDAPRGRRSIIISPEDEKRLDEMSYSSAPTKAAAPVKQEKPLGLMGTIREGAKSTLRTLGATVDTAQGDAAGVVTAAQEQAAAPKDPDLEKFYAHIDEQKKALGENPSLFEGIKAVGSAAINNPRGFGLMVAEQLPNSAAALGAGAAGALAGSLAGPVGTVAGGLAGLAGANIGLETGSKALEAAQDNQFTPEEQSRVKKEGLIKGGTITGVDALTLGATKFITGTTRRAVERATTKTLADNGVDVTNAAARKAALETPEIADAVKNAQELAKKGSEKLGQTLARTGGAVALETIGEGAGEYLGELAATGKANAVDAVVEGFAGLGTSIGEITATSALNRKGLQRLFDSPETAEKTAEEETKKTGVPHEVIQHPTEPDKFVAVPKVRSVGGIELERDKEGNLKPVQPTSTQTDFNIANKPGFDLTAEDKIREKALNKAREDQYAKNPIIVPGVTPTPSTNTKTIAGKPVSDLSKDALIYTVSRGSARAKQIATDELDRRNANPAPATPAAPETPTDAVKRIVATGAEKAKEDGKKAGAIVTPAQVAKPATAPKTAKPVTPKVAKPAAAPKPAPTPKPKEVKNENVSKTTEAAPQPVKPEPQPLKPENAAIPKVNRSSGDTGNTKNIQEQGPVAPPLKPKRKSTSARNKEAFAKLADHFTPGNIVKGYGGYDRVISFNKRENDWDVTVQGVKKDEKGNWVSNGHVRTHATFPDARNTIVERAPLKPEAKPESKAAPATEQKPTEEPAKTEAHPLRGHIESLIKRRAAAKQSGKDRTINSAIDRAKEVMNGTRTDAAREANWFKGHAAVVRKNDPATADILSKISETIKPKTEKVKANEKTEKPKTANEPVRRNKVAVPRGGRILANGIAETIQTKGVAALVGQKITSPERLAELAQVYRNPRYETFRIFFTKGNAIVHASGVTARLPGSTPLFPKDFTDAQAIGWMRDMMQSSGADGYWMLHNHPSGDPKPSDADLKVTGNLAKMLPGFKGHVIINSNKYGQITIPRTNPRAEVVIKQFGEDMLLKASKPSPYLGKIIQDPGSLSIVGKSFQKEGWVTLIGVSGTSGVRAVAEIPAKTFANPGLARAAIRRFGRRTGAESIFAYGTNSDLKTNSARLVRDGFLRSAMDDSGTTYGVNNSVTKFGQTPGMGGQELQQNTAQTNTPAFKKWFGNSKVVDADGKPLVVYHGTRSTFDAFHAARGGMFFAASPDVASAYAFRYGPSKIDSEFDALREELKAEGVGMWDLIHNPKWKALQEKSRTDGSNVIPVYLTIKNPFVVDGKNESDKANAIKDNPDHITELVAQGYDGILVRDALDRPISHNANDAALSANRTDVWITFKPEQIKSAIGNNGNFDDSAFILNQNASPFRDRMDKLADTLIYNFQDRFKPLKDIQKRAGPVPESEDASLAEERYSGTVRARTDTFEQQLRDPLLKAIHDSGVSFEGVEQYLHALHAPSRNAAMREINPTEPELKAQTDALEKQRDSLAKDPDVLKYIKTRRELRQAEADIDDGIADESLGRVLKNELAQLQRLQNVKDYSKSLDKLKALRLVKPFQGDNTALSGMSDAESNAILAKIDANGTRKALDKISAIVDTITSKTRQIYVDSGLEKADAIEAWDKKYEHYIPLHRDEVSGNTMPKVGQGFNIRGKESKRATGSNKDVTNILAHVVAQHEAAIIRSEKARVDRTLFQFAKTHPDPSLWTLDSAPMLRTVDPVSGFVVERVDPTYKNRPEVLTLKIDGEEHTITFNDQNQEAMRLAASMKNMSSEQLGEVTQMVGKLTRFLATMNTTMNPVFTARNFLRDLQTTFVNLSDTEIADKKREVFRDVPAAIKGMWALSRGKPNSQWAKYAQEFKSAGGQTGWMDHYKDIGERADTLKKELEIMKPGKMNATRRTLKSWFDIIQDANNAVENGARLSAFVHARKSGLSEGKAAQIAKNLTVNFNAHGAKGVELNAWYMFMNASIQGTARLAKAMTNRQVRKIVAGVVLSGFLMDILARSMAGDDDEDGENDYDQLPEHVKAMNFVLMVANRPVTIPMPYGYNFFASTGRKISEIMFRENYSAAKSAVDLAGIFMDAFSPTGQAGSGLQYLSPTVTDPFVQYAENKNFAGNPIRKPQNPFGVPNPEYQMGFKSTSAPGKWLAEALNNVTGGNEVRPGFVNVNPAFFDFAVSSIAGGAGRTYLQFASAPMKLANDDEVQAREVPFANIFVGARPEHQTEKKYFEAVKSVELAAEELKTYRAKGDTEMVQEIIHDHRAEIRMTEAAKETKRVLARLRKSDLALDKEDAPNKSELRKALEERKKEAMSRFNKKYREAVAAE